MKHIPYFVQGVLVFEGSGHTLTRDKNYYVCSHKQKGKCDLPEKRIQAETLERAFSRVAKTFEVPEGQKEYLAMKRLMSEVLHAQVDEFVESFDYNNLFESSVAVAKEDIAANDMRQFSMDIKDAERAIARNMQSIETPVLVGSVIGTILVLSKRTVSEAEMGRTVAFLSEKIYLTNEGNIKKIKPLPIASYIFQYMRHCLPTYQMPFQWLSEIHKFKSLDLREALKEAAMDNLRTGIFPSELFDVGQAIAQITQQAFGVIKAPSPESKLEFINAVQNSAITQLGMKFSQIPKKRKFMK